MKKLRLVVTLNCNRKCPGCCNNYWDFSKIPYTNSFVGYDEILLTGGEPMLYVNRLIFLISSIRYINPTAKIFMYTAKTTPAVELDAISSMLDGITITLHEQSDVIPFERFNSMPYRFMLNGKSLRLNIFKGIKIKTPKGWKVKKKYGMGRYLPIA